jgi:hypothetical protein
MVMAAVPKKRRRSRLISSDILAVSIGVSPWVDGYAADQPNVNARTSALLLSVHRAAGRPTRCTRLRADKTRSRGNFDPDTDDRTMISMT